MCALQSPECMRTLDLLFTKCVHFRSFTNQMCALQILSLPNVCTSDLRFSRCVHFSSAVQITRIPAVCTSDLILPDVCTSNIPPTRRVHFRCQVIRCVHFR